MEKTEVKSLMEEFQAEYGSLRSEIELAYDQVALLSEAAERLSPYEAAFAYARAQQSFLQQTLPIRLNQIFILI